MNDDEGEEGNDITMIDWDEIKISSEQSNSPSLAYVEPNSGPLPDPKVNLWDLNIIKLLANGKLTPQYVDNWGSTTKLLDHKTYQEQQESNGLIISSLSSCFLITLNTMR